MKIHEVDDGKLGAMVKDRHARLAKAHAAGLIGEHPSVAWNKDSTRLREIRNVGEAKPIEDLDHGTAAQDDPPATPGSAGLPDRPGAKVMSMDQTAAMFPGYYRTGTHSRQYQQSVDADGIVIVK